MGFLKILLEVIEVIEVTEGKGETYSHQNG